MILYVISCSKFATKMEEARALHMESEVERNEIGDEGAVAFAECAMSWQNTSGCTIFLLGFIAMSCDLL